MHRHAREERPAGADGELLGARVLAREPLELVAEDLLGVGKDGVGHAVASVVWAVAVGSTTVVPPSTITDAPVT